MLAEPQTKKEKGGEFLLKVKKSNDGNYYIYRRIGNTRGKGCSKVKATLRNWFMIKAATSGCKVHIGQLYFGNEWIGKKIKIKIEEIK